MTKVAELKRHLQPGQVYRRNDLEKWSNAVDRHLQELQQEGTLKKVAAGMYYYPKKVGEFPFREIATSFLRILLASVVMGVIGFYGLDVGEEDFLEG